MKEVEILSLGNKFMLKYFIPSESKQERDANERKRKEGLRTVETIKQIAEWLHRGNN
jgi:hypothetical protein